MQACGEAAVPNPGRHLTRLRIAVAALILIGACALVGSRIWRHGPDRAAARRTLDDAERLYRAGDTVGCLQLLSVASAQDPTWAEPVFSRCKLLERSGHIAEARDQAAAAHRLAPMDREITLKAVRLDLLLPRPVESEKLAREAVAQLPTSSEAHLFLGTVITAFGEPGREAEAVGELSQAVALDPGSASARMKLGELYSRMGKEEVAAQMLEQAETTLNAQVDGRPVPVTELHRVNTWAVEMRETAFALSQVYLRLRRTAESRRQSETAARASACADRLKALVARATMKPPDRTARAEIVAICGRGVGLFPTSSRAPDRR